jgi:hypothetical protein
MTVDHIPYEKMAVLGANILIRPMAYVFSPGNGTEAELLAWHKQIVDHAITDVKVPPAQFQLGIASSPKVIGAVTKFSDAQARCTGMLRTNNVGLCFFPDSKGFWKPCNDALNPPPTPAANTKGEPLQQPLAAKFP